MRGKAGARIRADMGMGVDIGMCPVCTGAEASVGIGTTMDT